MAEKRDSDRSHAYRVLGTRRARTPDKWACAPVCTPIAWSLNWQSSVRAGGGQGKSDGAQRPAHDRRVGSDREGLHGASPGGDRRAALASDGATDRERPGAGRPRDRDALSDDGLADDRRTLPPGPDGDHQRDRRPTRRLAGALRGCIRIPRPWALGAGDAPSDPRRPAGRAGLFTGGPRRADPRRAPHLGIALDPRARRPTAAAP